MDATISVWPFITWQWNFTQICICFKCPTERIGKWGAWCLCKINTLQHPFQKTHFQRFKGHPAAVIFYFWQKKVKRKLIGCYSLQNVFLCLENVGLFQITWHISDFQNHTAVSAAVHGAVHSTHLKKVVLYVKPTLAARLHTLCAFSCAFLTFHTEYPSENPALLILYFHSHWQTHT